MDLTLDDDARRTLALFEDVTGATGRDCLQTDDGLVVVVARGDMATAIGRGGETVERFEERIGERVRLVEAADAAADFVANALAPAAVYDVTIEERREPADAGDRADGDDRADHEDGAERTRVAAVEVADEDRGVAIGTDGRTIETARVLADRHFGVDDVRLE